MFLLGVFNQTMFYILLNIIDKTNIILGDTNKVLQICNLADVV